MTYAQIQPKITLKTTLTLVICAITLILSNAGQATADDKFGRAYKYRKTIDRQKAETAKRLEEQIEEERIANEPIAPFVVTVTKARIPDVRDSSYTDSIQKAVNMVATGGKIVIEPGDYIDNIHISRAVTLVGLRGDGTKVRVFPKAHDQSCLTVSAAENQHAIISNIEFHINRDMSQDIGLEPTYSSGLSGQEQYDSFVAGGKLANRTAQNIQAKASVPCVDVYSGILTMSHSMVNGLWQDSHGNFNFHQGSMVKISGGSATLDNNIISGGRYGVSVEHQDASLSATYLIDNHIKNNNQIGINLAGRAVTRATGNTIMENGNGIIYNGEGAATILANKIMNNGLDGVVLGSGEYGYSRAKEVFVRLNRIRENRGTGVRVYSSGGSIEDNFLARNGIDKNGKFIRNSKQIEFHTSSNGVIPKIDNNWINNKKPRNWR